MFEDAIDEIRQADNLRYPLEVCFQSEGAHDLGGPRREFFSLFMAAAKEKILEEDSSGVRLVRNAEYLARHKYFYTGIFIGLCHCSHSE